MRQATAVSSHLAFEPILLPSEAFISEFLQQGVEEEFGVGELVDWDFPLQELQVFEDQAVVSSIEPINQLIDVALRFHLLFPIERCTSKR